MKIMKRDAGKGVRIGTVSSDRYKNNSLTLNFMLPINDENISRCHVLSSVLLRGCRKYPTVTEIGRRLNMMYDPIFDIQTVKAAKALVFRVSVKFIDGSYLPEDEGKNIFGEITEMLSEILGDPFPEDEKLLARYTESEKKHQIDRIRADKNNKDSYAMFRCEQIMFSGTPFGSSRLGAEECVSAITPAILRETLDNMLQRAPVLVIYTGRYSERDGETINGLISSLFSGRNEENIIYPETELPGFCFEPKEVCEDADAAQGRAVLAYKMRTFPENPMKTELFNEIFGASTISRLFMNVRERLQLCYYCISLQYEVNGTMFVRSGVSNKNRETAVEEIGAQLEALKDPDNISDFEFEAAVKGLKSYLLSVSDDVFRYAEWYTFRCVNGRCSDIERYSESLDTLTKEDVSEVARGAELKVNYFLAGKGADK